MSLRLNLQIIICAGAVAFGSLMMIQTGDAAVTVALSTRTYLILAGYGFGTCGGVGIGLLLARLSPEDVGN